VERVLLYDAECVHCTAVAREVTRQSNGKIGIRSLHDPEIRTMLDRIKPGWNFRPMLLETDHDRVRARAGADMAVALVGAVGVRSAITLAGARERDARVSTTGAGALSRRAALRGGAVTALAVMFGARTALAQVDIPACAGVEGTPTTVSDTATLAQLRSHSQVKAAARAFGRPDWDAVLHVRGSHPVYVFSHPDNVYTAVGSNGPAVSFRLGDQEGKGTITWMGTNGNVWALSVLGSDRVMRTTSALALPAQHDASDIPALPAGWYACFTDCVGKCVTTSCAHTCFYASHGHIGQKAACLACAGLGAWGCAFDCWNA